MTGPQKHTDQTPSLKRYDWMSREGGMDFFGGRGGKVWVEMVKGEDAVLFCCCFKSAFIK